MSTASNKDSGTLFKLKELFFPALAGLDAIHDAYISPVAKLELYSRWQDPHASKKAYRSLKKVIGELEDIENSPLRHAVEAEIVRRVAV